MKLQSINKHALFIIENIDDLTYDGPEDSNEFSNLYHYLLSIKTPLNYLGSFGRFSDKSSDLTQMLFIIEPLGDFSAKIWLELDDYYDELDIDHERPRLSQTVLSKNYYLDLLNRGLGHAIGVIKFDHSTKECYWVEDGFSKISHNISSIMIDMFRSIMAVEYMKRGRYATMDHAIRWNFPDRE